MTTIKKTILTKDLPNKKLYVVREFAATRDKVWEAWTKSAMLDLWWAPKPWKAVTKSMDFSEGGYWLYYMSGPGGEKIWARVDFLKIDPQNSFTSKDSFCDELGNKTGDISSIHWKNTFDSTQTGTKVAIEMSFENESDIAKILEMGFEEGFAMAHGNLDELLGENG